MDKEQFRKACQSDFFTFCKAMTREDGYKFAMFHEFICNSVQWQLDNEENPRLMLSVPPGYGKSTIISKLLPAYLLGRDPSYKIILITYGSKLSDSLGKDCRAIMNKDIYKFIFPETIIEGDGKAGTFATTVGGGLNAVGRGGAIIGFRANFILCDDIIKNRQEALSDKVITEIHEWWPTVPMTRLLPKSGVMILSTRWTNKDLIGYVIEKDRGKWRYYNFEAICEDFDFDPIGRNPGVPLWGEFYTLESLLEIRTSYPKMFEVVYQGKPTSAENTPIDINQLILDDEPLPGSPVTIISVDTASKTNVSSDYSVFTVWSVQRDFSKAVMTHIYRDKYEFPELLQKFDEIDKSHQPHLWIVEDANSGIQLLQMRNEEWILPSKAIRKDDKILTAELFDLKIRERLITYSSTCALTNEIKKEIDEFPFGNHDDVALSILHFVKWFLNRDPSLFSLRKGDNGGFGHWNSKLKRFNSKLSDRRSKLPILTDIFQNKKKNRKPQRARGLFS